MSSFRFGTEAFLGVASPFFPEILLSRKPLKLLGKQLVIEKAHDVGGEHPHTFLSCQRTWKQKVNLLGP